ncbi:hypothetical protein FE773_02115 [Caminibacter mediatlanticus TB-2]|uniref:Bifunctional aconitate hydratase 2/2-methylisocitrate dehydratase n=1 Tax=Caminibacter mediatlanticus TB-2 TaxID=391592 RepID=A0AAI9AGZ8_9BACT|nr:phosphate-starvation-inducible PsiE family protein [Caminibacter mediatlanticus]EDM23440.1 bifunctional aconitate hydratase 2/2-methylisocitrate dehydratase [Caminibacter mediatlanticus TB-2]QCT94014.1 hypothetical protein FE773_02115 [Caminibacter mediatlanticus TB-2]
MKKYINQYLEILIALIIFGIIIFYKFDFYKVLALILELMVIIEVTQMLFIFFRRQRIKIRYMIDASILFFVRELLISTTTHKPLKIVIMYVGLIGIFFFFRYLSLKITYEVGKD